MSLETNNKILIGTTVHLLDKRLILGDLFDRSALTITAILHQMYEYSVQQYEAGNQEKYTPIIKALTKKFYDLKYQCPDVCIVKDRFIFFEEGKI